MTEHEIIRGCKQGVPLYQRSLVERYAPMLLTVARRYAPDRYVAEDILQDALLRIFHAIPRYENRGSFEGWMRRIVVTTALQTLKKNRRHWMVEDLSVQIEHASPTPPEVYALLDEETLLRLISRLPDGFRQIFNLYVMEHYSHAEIADLLGIAESTSRSQLTRARHLLQHFIAEAEKIKTLP